MLVALYRSGPLWQRLAKGYTVVGVGRKGAAGRDPAELVAALLARPPRLPDVPAGGRLALRAGPRVPDAVWIDTGRVSLHSPAVRAGVARAVAEAVALVADAVRRSGGLLVPSGWSPDGGPGAAPGLCADLHSLEVAGPVERELLCNLLRESTPPLIALTGRRLYGTAGASTGGSARLSRSTDQVTTRYIASFSPQHLDRVRAGLRREERLARLEAMDVNPLGETDVDAAGCVTLRLVDAQMSVASAMSHALLVQALAMRARELERTGERIEETDQRLVERNRSRAIAHGLAAEFDVEQRRQRQPGGRGRREGPGGGRESVTRTVDAGRAVLGLLGRLLPFFRQLDAAPEELAPVFSGLEMSAGSGAPAFVRNENDLLARWRAHDAAAVTAESLARGVASPQWLTADHIGEANRAQSAGSTAAARVWLAEQLSPEQPDRRQAGGRDARDRDGRPAKARRDGGDRTVQAPHGAGGGGRTAAAPQDGAGADRTAQAAHGQRGTDRATRTPHGGGPRHGGGRNGLTGEQLLALLGKPGVSAEDVVAGLRSYCRAGASLDLTRPLMGRGRDEAKAARRLLRTRAGERVRCTAPLESWDDPAAARALRGAGESGVSLLHWDLPAADRPGVRAALKALGRPPHDIRCVVMTDTTYTAKADERRGTIEVLLVAPAQEEAAAR